LLRATIDAPLSPFSTYYCYGIFDAAFRHAALLLRLIFFDDAATILMPL